MNNNDWRYTWMDPKCGPFDFRLFIFFFLFLTHPRLWTFSLFIICFIIFWVIEQYKRMNLLSVYRFGMIKLGIFFFGNGLFPRPMRYRSYYSDMPDSSIVKELNQTFEETKE